MNSGKGARTRRAILQAAVDCYNQYGYAKTTQEKIADRAGLSLGALTYHFSTFSDINRAAITYVFETRLEKHERLISEALSSPTDFEGALEIYWRETIDPLFIASHELMVAARTDPALKTELMPAHKAFRKRWNDNLLRLHPAWKETGELFYFAVEYSTYLVEGMAINWMLAECPEDRARDIRDFMKDHLEYILDAGRRGRDISSLLAAGRPAQGFP